MLDRNKVMADRASGLLQAEVKTALLLRILSGGSYHDLSLIFNIQSSSLYDVFHRTLKALLSTFKLPGIPEDIDELKKMALDFKLSRPRGSPLNGCIGALDGIAIKIRKPHKRFHPAQFYCRKGFYAIPVQAMVDSEYRFRCFSALCVGATHDSLSHEISGLGKFLRDGRLPPPFWIAADEAYVCTEFLLTPFSSSSFDRSNLSKYKDSFNYFQSSLRMHVEQAFGVLVGRFGILWRPLSFSLETNTRIVLATMLLHNFCIDHSKGPEPETMSETERRQHATAFRIWYHECRANISAQHEIASAVTYGDRAMQKSLPRREMVNFLRAIGLTRPYGQDRFDNDSSDEDTS